MELSILRALTHGTAEFISILRIDLRLARETNCELAPHLLLTTLGTGGRRAAQAVLSWKLCRGWPLRPRREGERRGTGVMESAAASESSSVEATVTLDPAELAEREAGATEMEEEVSARPTASSRCVATQQPLPSPKP